MATDFRTLSKLDLGALVAGGLAIIFSFFGSYIRVSFDGGGLIQGVSSGTNAWTSYATLGMLLIVAATAVVAVRAFAAQALSAGVPWNLVALVTSGVGTLLLILRALTVTDGNAFVSVGPGWSAWLLFIATIALTVCTALMFKNSGEKVPDFKTGGSESPAA